MHTIIRKIDRLSQGITMYKGISYGLLAIMAFAEVLVVLNQLPFEPLALPLVLAVTGLGCYIANVVFARLRGAAVNSESWLITALILTCIVVPTTDYAQLLWALLAAVLAMACKYFITWRHSHIFNPAAFGTVVLSTTGVLPAIWWVATPVLLWVTVPVAIITLYKHRKFSMFAVFLLAAIATMLLVNSLGIKAPVSTVVIDALASWPILFLGSVMLTEPITLPKARFDQLMYGLIVGVLFGSQLDLGPLYISPLLALLIGNVYAALVSPPYGAQLTLIGKQYLTKDLVELEFAKPVGLQYRAGQYGDITFRHARTDIRGNRRTFSFASARHEDTLRFAMRTVEKGSSFKRALTNDLSVGATVRLANGGGNFTLPSQPAKLLLIAGGIGITPLRSFVASLLEAGLQQDIELLYMARGSQHFAYRDLLQQAAAIGITTHYKIGRISAEDIMTLVPDAAERLIYISGPTVMVKDYRHALAKQGIAHSRILTDQFNGY